VAPPLLAPALNLALASNPAAKFARKGLRPASNPAYDLYPRAGA
jgi:hypothetical protein